MIRGPFGPGTIVLGGGALVLFGVLAIGFFLPTDWAVEAEGRIVADVSDVYAFIDSPEGWQAWTTWPDSGLIRGGPERGAGSSMSWADQDLGSGRFTIEDAAGNSVSYSVEVGGAGGSVMSTRGTIVLSMEGDAVLVRWREAGNLGRNPLMGFWALSMERAQTAELAKSLDRLAEVVTATVSAGDSARNP